MMPWNLDALNQPPAFTWAKPHDIHPLVRGLHYAGETYRGKDTRVAAWFAKPHGDGPFPGIVLVHGGGGRAYAEWAQAWAARGYAAIAMDHAGKDLDGETPLPDGGPDQEQRQKFNDIADGIKAAWPYIAVANTVRATSLLQSFAEVDAQRIAMTGISWGGYLTCIVSSIDNRIAAAAPVYGCGYLHESSSWQVHGIFDKLTPADRDAWVANFDPSQYLPLNDRPMLWVNGTNDFAYPMDSYQKSYRTANGERTLCIEVRMHHGHTAGWRPREMQRFFASHFAGGLGLARIGDMRRDGRDVSVTFDADVPIVSAQLNFTSDEGMWPKRLWHTRPALLDGNAACGTLPESDRPTTYFINLIDAHGDLVSAEHDVV